MKKMRKAGNGRAYEAVSRVEEALKKARAERDTSLQTNKELGQATVKKDTEIKKIRTELTRAKDYVTEYIMKEEEYVRETAKAKEEVESMGNTQGKYTAEVNSLTL